MNNYTLFDLEANDLYEGVNRIYCFSYQEFNSKGEEVDKGTLVNYHDIIAYLNKGTRLVGHNIIRYDIPVLEKVLKIKVTNQLVDTLALSWYLYPYMKKHGLDFWGEKLEIRKVQIDDWENLSLKEYIIRCEVDVEITHALFIKQLAYLQKIYENNDNLDRLIKYLSFKMDCLKDQEMNGIKLDVELAERTKSQLENIIDTKIRSLAKAMPYELGKARRTRPKSIYNKNGSMSYHAKSFFKLIEERGLSKDTKVIRDEPNPNSHVQLKKWLYMLGWKPQTWEPNDKGIEIEKVSLPFGGGICPSVKKLYDKEPRLEDLEGLYMAVHRLGVIKGFLSKRDKNNLIYAVAHGFTNTLRLKHGSPIVNLPKVSKPWGEEVRGCLTIANSNEIMCGSDVSSLEDSTKMHYMYYFDKEYVEEMSIPGFDGHIDIAIFAGLMTKEEGEEYKRLNKLEHLNLEEKKELKRLSLIRFDAKTINFGGVYGIGPPKLAKQMGITLKQAKALHTAYWERNKAVKEASKAFKTKKVNRQKWILNPISGFYLFLKEEKDKFSTVNQSSGAYVFDTWLSNLRKRLTPLGIPVRKQYHDEFMTTCKKVLKDVVNRHVYEAMEETNKQLKLNITIRVDTAWGNNYAECH